MAQELKAKGYGDVYCLKGGFEEWQAAGMPTIPKQEIAWAA